MAAVSAGGEVRPVLEEAQSVLEASRTPAAETRRPRVRWLAAAVVVLALVVALLASRGAWRQSAQRVAAPIAEIKSVAVLPLDNFSQDSGQDYFVDGMHEALITELSKIRALRVISRTSVMRYRRERKPLPEILLLEGPTPARMPDVHPHALKGAMVSLAAMWRLPLLHARDPEESLLVLRFLAQQARTAGGILKRYDRKPKRVASRRLYILQGLPGIGRAMAARLLAHLGSVERVMTSDVATLMQVRGVGPARAARIRELVS